MDLEETETRDDFAGEGQQQFNLPTGIVIHSNSWRRFEGSQSRQRLKYGQESRGSRNQEWLNWRGPAATWQSVSNFWFRVPSEQTTVFFFSRFLRVLNWGLILGEGRGLTTTGHSPLYWEWLERSLTNWVTQTHRHIGHCIYDLIAKM
jgi:hypothetical protein